MRTTARFLAKPVKSTIRHLIRPFDPASGLDIRSIGQFAVAYRKGTGDESVLRESFEHDIFFPAIPDYRPVRSDVIIDVGAHIGTFALLAASKVGTVYAIEACRDTFNVLRINSALNRADNLTPSHLALSDRNGTSTLYYDKCNDGHSVVSRRSRKGEQVECRTLKWFFDHNLIGRCALAKFNCEGAEFPILLSSSADLLQHIDRMLVLYHCDRWSKNTLDELLAHLQASGFHYKIVNRTEQRGWIVATRSKPTATLLRADEVIE